MDDKKLPKLNRTEIKILKVVADISRNYAGRVSITHVMQKAGISLEKLYNHLQNPEFRGLFIEAMKTSLIPEVPEILKAFVELAKEGSFKHGKLILELAGIYSEETNINLDAKMETVNSPFKTDVEKANFVSNLTKKYSYEVEDVQELLPDGLGGD